MNNNEKIDLRPDWMKSNEVGKGILAYKGTNYEFTILKKTVAPKLPGFLGYLDKKFLFISEEVPEKFRLPQLMHEIIEFIELSGLKDRCLGALERELSDFVPEDIKPEYIEYRRNFFKNLVSYYDTIENFEDKEFLAEIKASLDFLEGIK
ncbi:MAG: hypothetical protein K9L98_02255 [Candidatus Pacebacteria bacterium]|nr:hypothetical protein [Candidatus Paceibacterota bacterium]MCF7862809.1 hypothetical protein [Candidatus Paceibacterota bacterium]